MNTKIKQVLRIAFVASSIASLFLVPWVLVYAWILPLPSTVQEQLDEAVDHGFDGVIVYVDEAGKPPAFYAAGWHDPKNDIPAYPEALFKIASIRKLYTAVAVTKLVHSGHLSLDKTVADYLPELVGRIEYAPNITLRMLVQHQSGIPNYTDYPNYWASPKETPAERLELVLDQPAYFEPGEDAEYSNTNYLLLKEIMDRVLGYDHFLFVREEILIPLGLNNTFGSLDEVDLDRIMSGYHVGHNPDLKTDRQGMMATAEDVGLFLRALNTGSVFNPGEQEIYSSIYVYNHTGLIPGYQSIAEYHPDIDAVVIQFTSPTNFEGYNWNLSEIVFGRIVRILRKQQGS